MFSNVCVFVFFRFWSLDLNHKVYFILFFTFKIFSSPFVTFTFSFFTCCFFPLPLVSCHVVPYVASSYYLIASSCCLVAFHPRCFLTLPCCRITLPHYLVTLLHCFVAIIRCLVTLPRYYRSLPCNLKVYFELGGCPICCLASLLPHTSLPHCLVVSLPCVGRYFHLASSFARRSL
jgi:hypothetical protein